MARSRLLGFVAALFFAVGVAHAATQSAAEVELRKAVQEMLDAIAPGNAEVWKRYLHERVDVFFVAGQPRTRRIFVRDAQGKVVAFVDRREGEDIRWNRR